ncbi:MAG: amino acid adenylation domain-containing protein [Bacteroidota bacterium]
MPIRSVEILAIILAAFKAGKAYVPIDVNYPEERIRYIVEDADLQLLVVDRESREKIPFVASENCLLCESISHTEPFRQQEVDRREETAYLIYTSGSTGRPKGVEITHRNLIAFLKWCHGEFRQTPYELLYAATSYCFDLSVFEMLLPLLQGKRIRILTSALDIPLYLADDRQVMINTVPSVVRHLLEQNISWQHVVALNMAGEPVPKIFKYQLDYQKMEVRNLYGPSEDTTYSSIYRFSDDRLPIIPIGRPVGDTHAYVLDATGQLQPIGVEGEICLSGESVAKGYFGRPDLTAEKFIPNPFHSNLRMYRTGDIGKWLPDGQLAFIGRIDDQVKLRGYRIELGEIQYQLESLPQVKQAVVIVLSLQAEKSIVAYYELESPLAKEKVEKHLSEKLPAYMLPSVLMELERIPLNSNGKVDKKKLPRPDRQSEVAIVGPKNATQEALVGMWSEILKREDFGIHHNFFELGGHSLKATRLRHMIDNRMGKNLLLNEIFQYPTIEQQAEILDGKAKQSSAVKIEKAEQSGQAHPLSFAQERLWVLSRFADASKAYHMPAAFEWKGTFNLVLFEEAMKMVIARHESLRTVFREIDNVPMQWIQPVDAIDFALEQVYVEAGESLEDKLTEDWNQPFSLENGPLMRCRLFEQEDRRVLSFNMHHIISDGWSVAVLSQDVLEAYSLLQKRERTSLLPLEIQYKDFATWQRNKLSGAELERQLSYWRDEVFSQGIRPLELPYDFKRPEVKTYEGSTHLHRFSPELTKAIKAQAANFGMSLFMSLMAHVNILMKKLSNQSQITIGTPSSGRDNQQLNRQIGFYVNTLPINSLVDGNASFKDFLQTQRQQILTAFEYQHFPFEMLVEKLQPRRDLSRSPLFDVMLVLQNFDILDQAAAGSSEDLSFERLSLHSGLTKYDLTFSFAEINGSLQLELEYNRQLFKTKSMERMSQQLTRILQTTTRRPDLLLKDISIIDEQEQKLLFSKADQTRVGYRSEETIVSLFQQQVQNQPESPALKMGPTVLTYAQLDQLSGQLAAKLTDEYQLSLEAPVLLHTQRTEWMMVAILGVLKAGGYYVPVDPDYPLSRKQYIFEDCQAVCVLTDHSLPEDIAAWLSQAPVLDVSKLVYDGPTYEAGIRPDQLAYMIYTSGTTGQPKGVQIEHRNVNRLLFNDNDLFDFGPTDRWCLFHSYCFDFSVWEMYGALLKGGQLHMVPRETAQDSRAFFQFLQDEQITVLNQTPTAFRSLNLANKEEFSQTPLSVRCLIFGGEALLPELLTDWHQAYPDCRLVNMYGITETTVHVTYKEITAEEIQLNKSNIGIPIPTLSCYVLDEDLRPVPVGVTGELCVGGAGVARGYHQRPELTAQKFVPNPFREGERMYRSGDFARVLANGDLEYIGRRDEQVKIRGHRIELSEVGTAIAQLPSVEDAVVNIQKNAVGEFELIAYIIPAAEQESNATNHRLALSELLPSYMIPLAFIELEAFPLTPNGKLDQKALAALHQLPDRQSELVPARNEIDQTIIDIWQEVLDRQGIGITDNFFDLGGHSLKATRVASLIQERLGVRIDLKNLFIDPTVEHLSNYVETLQWIDEKSEEEDSQDNEWIL